MLRKDQEPSLRRESRFGGGNRLHRNTGEYLSIAKQMAMAESPFSLFRIYLHLCLNHVLHQAEIEIA